MRRARPATGYRHVRAAGELGQQHNDAILSRIDDGSWIDDAAAGLKELLTHEGVRVATGF